MANIEGQITHTLLELIIPRHHRVHGNGHVIVRCKLHGYRSVRALALTLGERHRGIWYETSQLIGARLIDDFGAREGWNARIERRLPDEEASAKRRAIRVVALLVGSGGAHAEGTCVIHPAAQTAKLRRNAAATGVVNHFGAHGELVTNIQRLGGLNIDRAANAAGRGSGPARFVHLQARYLPRTPG